LENLIVVQIDEKGLKQGGRAESTAARKEQEKEEKEEQRQEKSTPH
jgi:hypothetical protein